MKPVVHMIERKQKPRSGGAVELDIAETCFVLEPTQVEVGSGYMVTVDYDENEEQVVEIKTFGHVDLVRLRREIRRLFPDAKIRRLNHTQSVVIAKRDMKKRRSKRTRKRD
jgi:hypothetical protein